MLIKYTIDFHVNSLPLAKPPRNERGSAIDERSFVRDRDLIDGYCFAVSSHARISLSFIRNSNLTSSLRRNTVDLFSISCSCQCRWTIESCQRRKKKKKNGSTTIIQGNSSDFENSQDILITCARVSQRNIVTKSFKL